METHANTQTPAHAPIEDISVVLSRFQAWTGSQAVGKSKNGIRELSYEEAVGRKRRPEPARTAASVSSKKTAAPPPAQTDAAKQEEAPRKKIRRKAKARKTKPVPQLAKEHAAAKPAILKAQTNFRAALAERVAIVPSHAASVVLRAVQPVAHRSLTLSVRISEPEQAFFKARAEAENLSVSAYLRQCAFEVERLRGQLHQAAVGAPVTVIPQARTGFFARLGGLFAPKKATFALHV